MDHRHPSRCGFPWQSDPLPILSRLLASLPCCFYTIAYRAALFLPELTRPGHSQWKCGPSPRLQPSCGQYLFIARRGQILDLNHAWRPCLLIRELWIFDCDGSRYAQYDHNHVLLGRRDDLGLRDDLRYPDCGGKYNDRAFCWVSEIHSDWLLPYHV